LKLILFGLEICFDNILADFHFSILIWNFLFSWDFSKKVVTLWKLRPPFIKFNEKLQKRFKSLVLVRIQLRISELKIISHATIFITEF
jgi:hypothetical protein